MPSYATRRKKADVPRFILGVAFVLVLSFVSFSAAHAAYNMYGKFSEATASNDASQQNLKQMQNQLASVKAQVEALSTHEGQEAQLRQSYGVALPGEGEIQLVQKSASTTEAAAQEEGFFARIFRALFLW
jgi:cell division protein FtsB